MLPISRTLKPMASSIRPLPAAVVVLGRRFGHVAVLLCAFSACTAWHWHTPFGHAAAAKLTESGRSQVPKPAAAVAFHAPVPESFALDNGLTVLLVQRTQLPLVHAALVVRGGSASDRAKLEGETALLLETAKLGTANRSAAAIADQMESLGASLDVMAATESVTFATKTLKHNLLAALDILADVSLRPALLPAELGRAKASQLADIEQRSASPAAVAQLIGRSLTFGSHPYAHAALGSAASVARLTVKDLKAHHAELFDPAHSALILVGDIDAATARATAAQYFGEWQPAPSTRPMPAVVAPMAQGTEVALVDRPGAPQADCLLTTLGIGHDAPEYPALVLGNAILGGMFNSRINMNLREAKGWTYGARASLVPLQAGGLIAIQSALRTDVAVEGIEEILHEAEKMQAEEVSTEELKAAKNRHVLSIAGRMETLDQIGGQVSDLFIYGLPLNYWQALPARLNQVHTGDVLAAMRAVVVPSQLSITVVGDRGKMETKLMGLGRGPIHLYDAAGTPLPDAPASKAPMPAQKAAAPVKAAVPAAKSTKD